MEARQMLEKRQGTSDDDAAGEENQFQFDMDGEHESLEWTSKVDKKLTTRTFWFGAEGGMGRNPLSKLEEGSDEEEQEEVDTEDNDRTMISEKYGDFAKKQTTGVSTLSKSLKSTQIGEKSWQHEAKAQKNRYVVGASSSNRSVYKQLPASSCFVKFADMHEEEWNQFLDNFQKLVSPAFANRRSLSVGQRQRLGTYCRF